MRVQIYRLSVIVSIAFLASCAPLPPELTQQIPINTPAKTPESTSEKPLDKLAELPAADDTVIPQSDNLTTSQDDSTSDQSLIAGDDNQTASPKPILLDNSQDEAADKTDETLIAQPDNQSLSDDENTSTAIGALIGQISDDTDITTPQSGQPEDNQSIDDLAEAQTAIVIAPEPKTEPEPEPEPEPITPVNPYLLTGSVSDLLTIRLGKADRIISEQGVEVRHYYEADCHSLFFLFDKGQGLRIQHVDVRPAILKTALDELACFDALGVRSVNLQEADK